MARFADFAARLERLSQSFPSVKDRVVGEIRDSIYGELDGSYLKKSLKIESSGDVNISFIVNQRVPVIPSSALPEQWSKIIQNAWNQAISK